MTADVTPWDPFERLIRAVLDGRKDAVLYAESDDGLVREMPATLWFRDEEDFDELEGYALRLCRGHVADVGAGVGPHALALMRAGLRVTAIDTSSVAVDVLRQRGVEDSRVGNVMDPPETRFDTLLLLMNGIGLVGSMDRLEAWCEGLAAWLTPGGQVILDTTDLTRVTEAETRGGAAARSRLGRHPGEVMFRLTFDGVSGSPFPWLFVTPAEIDARAEPHGFRSELLYEENARSLIRLTR